MSEIVQMDSGNQSAAGQSTQPVILYVEDNAANLMLVEVLFARRGNLALLSATEGLTGVAMARAHQPAAILMDIKLPDISGSEALKMLLDDPATAHIPVIALSSHAHPRQIEEGISAGFFRYLTKPYKIEELMTAVEAALTRSLRQAA